MYKPGAILVLSNELLPEFGEIQNILVYNTSHCLFMCKLYVTNCFNPHFHSYEVYPIDPARTTFTTQSNLFDYHVVAMHSLSSFPHFKFVTLKYHLLEMVN
jgi:hypothetical protein